MKNRSFIILSVVIFIIITISVNLYLNRSGSIKGKVVYGTDETVTLNDVSIIVDNGETFGNNVITGIYFIPLKPGKHKLVFKKDGYLDSEREVETLPGIQNELLVNLFIKPLKTKDYSGYNLVSANSGSGSLSIFNINENKIINEVNIGKSPYFSVILPEKGKIYVSDSAKNGIAIIDIKNFQLLNFIDLEKGSKPTTIILSPQKDKLLVLNSDAKMISSIGTSDDKLTKEYINFKDDKNIRNIFQNPSDSLLYLVKQKTVYSFSEQNEQKKYDLTKDLYYCNVAFFKNENKLIITDEFNKDLIFLDIYSGKETRIAMNDSPVSIITESLGFNAYILFSDYLSIFDLTRKEFVKEKILTGGSGAKNMVMSPDNSKIFIANSKSNDISVFNIADQTMNTERIKVNSKPLSVNIY